MHGLPVQRPLHAVAGIKPVDRRRPARPRPHVIVTIVRVIRSCGVWIYRV